MATTKCPTCGYSESDGRPHDRATYLEVCIKCAAVHRATDRLAADVAKIYDVLPGAPS